MTTLDTLVDPKKIDLFEDHKKDLDLKPFISETSLPLDAHSISVNIGFKHCCLNSIKDDDLFFSNYIYDCLSSYNDLIGLNLKKLFVNPKVITERDHYKQINFFRSNGTRAKNIFSKFMSDFDCTKYIVYESYITNDFTKISDDKDKGKFRVFSLYIIKDSNTSSEKQWLIVFLIDPHHLVFPISKMKKMKSIESKKLIYKKIQNYNCDLRKLFNEKCKNNDIDYQKISWFN